ncbi:MAG: cupin domain-containing protein [Anaerolineales bacterium]|nr:cupin domain-containing protein [Anaerolineales bacterium]
MTFYDINTREYKTLLEGVQMRTFWGENMLLAIVDLKANSVIPVHNHPHEQAGIVLSGELDFDIDGDRRLLHQGDIYIIPSGVNHKVCVGVQPAQVLDIFSPAREEYKY